MASGRLLAGTPAAPPPIGGVTGTVALEGTVQRTDEGLNTVLVKMLDGIKHLFHLT